jgi:hypothetical protein
MNEGKSKKVTVAICLSPDLTERIAILARKENRPSRSNMYETLLLQALDGGGIHHSRIIELAGSYLLDLITAEEAMREISTLVLAPSTVDGRQLQLEIPAAAQG